MVMTWTKLVVLEMGEKKWLRAGYSSKVKLIRSSSGSDMKVKRVRLQNFGPEQVNK